MQESAAAIKPVQAQCYRQAMCQWYSSGITTLEQYGVYEAPCGDHPQGLRATGWNNPLRELEQ